MKKLLFIIIFTIIGLILFGDVIILQNYSINEGEEFVLDLNKILNDIVKGAEFSIQDGVGQVRYGIYTYQTKNEAPSVHRIVIKVSNENGKSDYIIFNLSVVNVNLPPEFIEEDFSPKTNEKIEEKSIILSWNAFDPDNEKLTYDVYFGSDNNLELIKENTVKTNIYITDLEESTNYLWKIVASDELNLQKSSKTFSFKTTFTPELLWQRCLGGSENESGYKILETNDGYLIVGNSNSNDGNVRSYNKDQLSKGWIIKLDKNGYYMWQRSLGEYGFDKFMDVVELDSGNFILTGISYYDKSNNNDFDIWIIEMDKDSYVIWQKVIGGKGDEAGYRILPTSDGDFIVVGFTSTNGSEEYSLRGSYDFFAVKVNKEGKIIWQKNYGGSSYDSAVDIVETSSNEYIIVGNTRSSDMDVENFYSSNIDLQNIEIYNRDIWIIKISNDGDLIWQDTLGGKGDDFVTDIVKDSDNQIFVIASSNTINLTPGKKSDDYDIVVYKLDPNGNLLFRKSYGDTTNNFSSRASLTENNKIVLTGHTESVQNKPDSYDLGILGNVYINDSDLLVYKIDEKGNVIWEKKYGGTGNDIGKHIIQLSDKNYLIVGETTSNDGEIDGNHGRKDILILKIGQE